MSILKDYESMVSRLLFLEREIATKKMKREIIENELSESIIEYDRIFKFLFSSDLANSAIPVMSPVMSPVIAPEVASTDSLPSEAVELPIEKWVPPVLMDGEFIPRRNVLDIKASLYILTFNSPDQVRSILESFKRSDSNFLMLPRKILVDNSTKESVYEDYRDICEEYGFEWIKQNNIGICGARQLVAEHFDASDSDYYIFFEDDMHLYSKTVSTCSNGHKNYIDDLYIKSLSIIDNEGYDYLKLSYTEFFGDCGTQWGWYNIPQHIREKYFPNNCQLPTQGLSSNPPRTEMFYKKRFEDLTYIAGEFHYCNWPIWFSREGNKKVFLDITWAHPYEQTWMSQVFQLQKEKTITCAVLELSPINHDRFEFYGKNERKEN